MRNGLTAPPLIQSHFFAASNLSIIGPLYSTLRIPHSSSYNDQAVSICIQELVWRYTILIHY
jgi:hypothetical protein